jgi:phage gp36-like protein
MPDYIATVPDEIQEFYKLPDQQALLDEDLASVEGVVNSYVGKRYAVPVTDPTALTVLLPLAKDLLAERAAGHGAGSELQAKITQAADRARTFLEAVASGAVTLAGATALTERTSGGAEAIVVEGNAPEFTHDKLKGF